MARFRNEKQLGFESTKQEKKLSNNLLNYIGDNFYSHFIEEFFDRDEFDNSGMLVKSDGNSSIKFIPAESKGEYNSGDQVNKKSYITVNHRLNDFVMQAQIKFKSDNTTFGIVLFDDGNGNFLLARITLTGSSTKAIVLEKYISGSLDSVIATDTTDTFNKDVETYDIAVKVIQSENRIRIYSDGTLRLDVVIKNLIWGLNGFMFDAIDDNSKIEINKFDLLKRIQEVS